MCPHLTYLGGIIIDNSTLEALQYMIDNGKIDLAQVQEEMEMKKREELLAMNPWSISAPKSDKWWRSYIPDETKPNKRRQIKKSSKKAVEDEIIAYWRQQSENPTIEEVFTEWDDRRLQLGKISKATHLRNRQTYDRHYKEFGKRRIKSISPEDIEEFLEEQIPKYEMTAKAFSNLKTITRGFLKRAKKRKLISFNVEELFQELDVSDTDFKKVIKEDYEEVFNDEEMSKMMKYLIENLDTLNLGILIMFVTGERIGEVVTLKHEDFSTNTINIRRTETRYRDDSGKYVCEVKDFPKSQAGVRTVVLPEDYEWITKEVKKQNPDGEYVFVKDGSRVTAQAMRMRLRRLCKNLGIYHKSPHKIRKTYGSILLDNNVDKRFVTGQMGQTDIMCTEEHYHRNRRSIDKKSRILSDIPEFQAKQKHPIPLQDACLPSCLPS